ncbi:MAG: Coat F domain protein [Firmicutes bacterium ADurb.Bin182]|nr:MAG: Coat F domain protein [Firmicutes bacterium ADurb.Bin182]
MLKPLNRMSDKELLTELFNEEKQLIREYSDSVTRVFEKDLRDIMVENIKSCAGLQYDIFEQMLNKGMHKAQNAESRIVRETMQSVAQLKQELIAPDMS